MFPQTDNNAVSVPADCLNVLLTVGADACAQNDDGNTALHIAAARGHPDCCALLLLSGANIAVTNNVSTRHQYHSTFLQLVLNESV